MNMKLSFEKIDALVFDFDGVLTDNTVFINDDGQEWVRCNRGDGLAFNELEKLGIKSYILSSEKNSVVSKRGKKLNIPVIQGVSNKLESLSELCKKEGFDIQKIFYIGNDLNDYIVMKECGFSACPNDSHPRIKEIATFTLRKNGGSGIVRELLEEIFWLDTLKLIYNK